MRSLTICFFLLLGLFFPMLASAVLPGVPTNVTATAGNGSATVSFTPGSIGSGTLVNHWAACGIDNTHLIYGTGSNSPITVTGLTNGTVYYCWALTRSTVGDSNWSTVSNSVTPASAPVASVPVIEFYNTNLDNYFITADSGEAAAIDSGSAGPGWSRTGNIFASGGSASVCRFYGSQSPGPNSHFYTADSGECAYLKQLQASTPATQKRWNFESLDFLTTVPVNGTCPAGTTPVYRAYNNGSTRGVDSNHRITSNLTAIQQQVARGWSDEGVVMCAPAGSTASDGTLSGNSPDQAKFIAARGYPHLFTLGFVTEAVSGGKVVPLTPPRRLETWVYNDANVTSALFDNGFFISQTTLGAHTSFKSTNLKPEKFTLGMTEAQVIAVAGQPTCVDTVQMAGRSMRFLRYASTADSPVAAVGLIDGALVSVIAGFLFSDQPNPGTNLCSAPF